MVGGGPAGLAAGIALAQAGFETTVLERGIPPIDKACGEGVMPEGIAAITELGLKVPSDIGFRFAGIRFRDAHSVVAGNFPNGEGLGMRRTVLHSLLVRRAQNAGVAIAWGVKNVHFVRGGLQAGGRAVKAKFVVAADGQNSHLRSQAGLDRTRRERRRYGFRRHYRIAPWCPYTELYWGPGCQIYITPVAKDELCVALLSSDPRLRLETALTHFPEVRCRLESAIAVSKEMGGLSVSRTLQNVCNSNVALVGDASGSVDAVTGDGLSLAFSQSLALAAALKSGDIRSYQAQHRQLSRRPQMMALLMLTLDKTQWFQRRALASLARTPTVFEKLLDVHVGARSFKDLASRDLVNLCETFLFA